jgi:hypothetical protein
MVLGVAVFVLYGAVAPDRAEERAIVVDAALRERLSAEHERRYGRAPEPDQLAREVDRWIDEEVLYREGLALGLDREDPLVRSRVVENMTFLHEQSANAVEPTTAELEAWFAAHRDLYGMPDRIDFVQVFAGDSQPRADALAAELGRGASVEGEPFRMGRDFFRRSRRNVESLFGEPFAAALFGLAPGRWEVVRSTHGLHVVRVDAKHGGDPRFDLLRDRIANDWRRERQREHAREAAARLRERYVVREEP